MRNIIYRITSAIARVMYGRSGPDQLNMALLAVYLCVWVIQLFPGWIRGVRIALEAVSLIIMAVILYRMFSRNLEKRREENAKFLSWWNPVRNKIAAARQMRLDKEHKYFTCKRCKTVCRVPAGKGKVEITCPKCGGKIIGRS